MTWRVEHGDCLDVMRGMADASVDAVVSDPPYGLVANKKGGSGIASVNLESPYGRARIGTGNGPGGFMGMKWDGAVPGVEFWTEALRVAKPGAHLLAFGGTRTFHRLAVAIEDAGWEVRDCFSWLFGTGFPKSHNLDGAWDGWGTALKPAWEPIIVARKPLVGTVARNVAEHGTGALNIDGTRVGYGGKSLDEVHREAGSPGRGPTSRHRVYREWEGDPTRMVEFNPSGRWPANVILDEDAAAALDAQTGALKSGSKRESDTPNGLNQVYGKGMGGMAASVASEGGASRFFYVAKASRSEREAGLYGDGRVNVHPTVKPVDVMRWLCRLVTPPNGIVLDPFTGSGTTGVAALREGFRFIGIEREAQYVEIARARIAAAEAQLPLPSGG